MQHAALSITTLLHPVSRPWGLDYTNPNFVTYANSYGAVGHKPGRLLKVLLQ